MSIERNEYRTVLKCKTVEPLQKMAAVIILLCSRENFCPICMREGATRFVFVCERDAIATNYLCRTRHFSLALFPVHCVRYALCVYFESRKIIMDFSVNFNAVKMFETATKLYFRPMFPQRRAPGAAKLKILFVHCKNTKNKNTDQSK